MLKRRADSTPLRPVAWDGPNIEAIKQYYVLGSTMPPKLMRSRDVRADDAVTPMLAASHLALVGLERSTSAVALVLREKYGTYTVRIYRLSDQN